MKALKFGGSVLRRALGFEGLRSALALSKETSCVIIVSALGKTSRRIEAAARLAEAGKLDEAKSSVSAILYEHEALAAEAITFGDTLEDVKLELRERCKKLERILESIAIVNQLTPRTRDLALSYGERLSLAIVAGYLSELKSDFLQFDATEIIRTDSNFGAASPDYEATLENVRAKMLPAFEKCNLALIQGFIGADAQGEVTTMGLESSNLTAALLADCLEADEIRIFTDVAGIRSADPKLVSRTKSIEFMDYDSAYVAALSGLKLIYPKMIDYARRKNIRVTFLNGESEDAEQTVINRFDRIILHPIIITTPGVTVFDFKRNALPAETLCSATENADFSISIQADKARIISKNPLFSPEQAFNGLEYTSKKMDLVKIIFLRHDRMIYLTDNFKSALGYVRPEYIEFDKLNGSVSILVEPNDIELIIKDLHKAVI
ncbi:MAG: hypothetical protein ACM3U1_05380 [Chloroflexota bacterium]